LPDTGLAGFWYYAMQQMGDDRSAIQSRTRNKLNNEIKQVNLSGYLYQLCMQIQLNEITKSDLKPAHDTRKKRKNFENYAVFLSLKSLIF
jgi:ABC-2 type transport system permease protein